MTIDLTRSRKLYNRLFSLESFIGFNPDRSLHIAAPLEHGDVVYKKLNFEE